MVGLTWWSRLAAVVRTDSRATAGTNRIWGVYIYKNEGCTCIKRGCTPIRSLEYWCTTSLVALLRVR